MQPNNCETVRKSSSGIQKRFWALLLVMMAAVGAAILLYLRFLDSPRLLWNDVIHDRNAHLYSGLCLATDLQHGYFRHLLSDLDSFRTWPPLHDGLLVGFFLLLGRGDPRWAALPSLLAWVGTVVFAFLIARRASPRNGTLGGLLAAAFVLVSPAQRAYATDVMIESLGACLTLACLYFYIVSLQEETPVHNRWFALCLTLLFFSKYNYWLLVVFGLAADQITANRKQARHWLRSRVTLSGVLGWLVRQARHPLSGLFLLLITLIALIECCGWTNATLFGRHISLRPTANLILVAYIVLILRLAPWYRNTARPWLRNASPRIRTLVNWHLWPMAVWFLWPHRLYSFFWVLSPASNAGEFPKHDLVGGWQFYAASIAHDYHVGFWSALAAATLFLAAVWAGVSGRLRAGATAVLWLAGIALLLTVPHQNRKSRFLHSWIPVVWVGAGIGAAAWIPTRYRGKRPILWLCGSAAVGALILWQLSYAAEPAHSPEGGIHSGSHSVLDVTDSYLPDLESSRGAAVFSNLPMKYLAQWTYLQRYGRSRRLETDIKGFESGDAAQRSAAFQRWLASTDCDTIVYVDFPPGSAFYQVVPGAENLPEYGRMLHTQARFSVSVTHAFPQYGCQATVWKRVSGITF